MRTVAFAVLALVCLQAVAGFKFEDKKPVYEPKKPVYVKPVYVKPVPAPKPSPKPVEPVTVTCTPKAVLTVVKANVSCSEGYTLSDPSAYKKGVSCSKQVCVLPVAKPVYEPKKPVFFGKKGHYFFGKKEDKKPVYEAKKPVYTPAPKPVYVAPVPAPKPSPAPVCHIEYSDPKYTCATGYTLSGSSCILSTPGPCPPTYTAAAGVCSYTFTPVAKPVYEPKKPVFSGKKGHYFFGKLAKKVDDKFDKIASKFSKHAKTPAGPNYCDDSLYPKPSPVVVKPVYKPKFAKKEINPKAIIGAVFSKFSKHD